MAAVPDLLIGSEAVELPASLSFLEEIRATSPMARFLLLAGPDVAAATGSRWIGPPILGSGCSPSGPIPTTWNWVVPVPC